MSKGLMWRLILVASMVVLAVVLFLPSLDRDNKDKSAEQNKADHFLPDWWRNSKVIGNKINLGLDLQGGMHLVYQVQTEKAVEATTTRMMSSIKAAATEKKIQFSDFKLTTTRNMEATLQNTADLDNFRKIVTDLGVLEITSITGGKAEIALKKDEADRIKTSSVIQAVETIRNRIDAIGVAEPLIIQQGTDELLVQLPGIKDPQRALDIIGKTALLEFRMLDETTQLSPPLPGSVAPGGTDALIAQYQGKLPEGVEILFQEEKDPATHAIINKRPYLIKRDPIMTGSDLVDARVSIGQTSQAEVDFKLNPAGAKLFGDSTAANVGKRMAIILDGNVYSAPSINEPITGGSGRITGNFTETEAKDLAVVLRAGALPAPLKPLQNLTVGSSLGNDSIEAGKNAILYGSILVLIFMAVYYKTAGVIADFAVALNIIALLGLLAVLNATLTLPGLAGILLTIGMGVDSNVLIFERIREEIRSGKTVRAAIDGGYDKAFWTVFDSHVTTLITAMFLFQFGTGPIKGFAVSLSLGIMINLFTALVGTKVVFDLMHSNKKVDKLSI